MLNYSFISKQKNTRKLPSTNLTIDTVSSIQKEMTTNDSLYKDEDSEDELTSNFKHTDVTSESINNTMDQLMDNKIANNESVQNYDNVDNYESINNSKKPLNANVQSKELLNKLNYVIHLLEEQQNQKSEQVFEELILYCFLGVFIIFTIDSFVRVGRYTR
jgi:hypothetical protein